MAAYTKFTNVETTLLKVNGTDYNTRVAAIEADVSTAKGKITALEAKEATKANKAQEAWITPTLLNSWTQADATDMPVRYRKDEFGIVHLSGRLSGGTADTVAFTLPVGYRPSKRVGFACYTSSGTHGKAYVLATGEVCIYEFNSYIQIDSISFFVD